MIFLKTYFTWNSDKGGKFWENKDGLEGNENFSVVRPTWIFFLWNSHKGGKFELDRSQCPVAKILVYIVVNEF